MTQKYHERLLNIENILLIKNPHIDQQALRQCCLNGIPDKFRPLVWRLFLDYLPAERNQWASMLERQRSQYRNLVDNLVVKVVASQASMEDEEAATKTKTTGQSNGPTEAANDADHPLALEQNSQWTGYFKDNEMLKQIENDVRRLRPEIDFFQRRTPCPLQTEHSGYIRLSQRVNHEFLAAEEAGSRLDKFTDKSFLSNMSCSSSASESFPSARKKQNSDATAATGDDSALGEEDESGMMPEKHWEVVERILYIFSKVNAGIRYVQGMNELLGPIYYVFATDSDDEWAKHAEADSFYCFQNLMSEMQDIFIRKMDSEHCGIEAALLRLYAHLQRNDPAMHSHLAEHEIKAEFFAFRWISLLLSQEFSLPDLIAIWDHLFATKPGTRLLRVECLCLAMLEQLRPELLAGDFPSNLRLLQNFPDNIDVSNLVIRSMDIFDGHTFRELNAKNQNGNGNSKISSASALLKSHFTTPFKSLMADTAAKLMSTRIGGGGSAGPKPGSGERAGDDTNTWKNATL